MYTALDTAPAGYSRVPLKYGPYSTSKLQVARCPSRFEGKFIIKDQTISENINAARGNAIHLVLQKITEAKQKNDPINVTEWVAEAVGLHPAAYAQVDVIRRAAAAYVGNPCPYVTESVTCEISYAVALYKEESFLDDITPGRAYVKLATPTDGTRVADPNAYFSGKADIVALDHLTQTVTIVDHKTTPNASVNQDHIFQMGCYAWLTSLYYPGYKIRSVIHYAHPDLNFYAPPHYWDMEDLQDFENEIRSRIFAIESFVEWPALPNSQCDYCHMTQLCPQFIRMAEQHSKGPINLNVNNAEDAQKLAQSVHVLGKLYDQVNTALKEGLEKLTLTSVAIDGVVYGFKKGDKKIDWDDTDKNIRQQSQRAHLLLQGGGVPEEQVPSLIELEAVGDLEGLLKKHGLKPETFKAWKGDKLKALYKLDKPALMQDIQKLAIYDSGTRFGAHKT